MKLINNLLYIHLDDLANCGVTKNYLQKARSTGTKCWNFIDDPADARIVLVEYESMRQQYKDCLNRHFGNVYDYVARQPIKNLVQKDWKAEDYYLNFPLDDNKRLPIDYVNKYTTAAGWLNMLIKADADRKSIKKLLNLTIEQLYTHVIDLIQTDNIDLPATYVTLRRKLTDYRNNGYDALISGKFGNKSAAKIGKTENGYDAEVEQQIEALIRKAASKHNKFDAVQITRAVNMVLEAKKWPTISVETVRLRMCKFEHLTTAGNSGKRTHNNRIAMQVERVAPTHPLLYWTMDGWDIALLYQGPDSKGKWSYSNRLVVVVVLDACGKYPVGYAIGERENTELIKQANRNALLHVKQLFGHNYRPNQVQSDHYGIKTLTPFYNSMAHLHTPAAVGNAKSKIIEPYFKYLNKTYCQPQQNWSGFNLSSSNKNQPNREFLDKIKKTFPTRDELVQTIEAFMEKERASKITEYYAAFETMPVDAKAILCKEDFLMIFGRPTDRTLKIYAAGLQPQINNVNYSFTTFDPKFAAHQDIDWRIIYDEQDMSQVLAVNEEKNLQFLLTGKRKVAMDVYSSTPQDHAYRAQITNFNKDRREELMQQYITDATIVDEMINGSLELDAESETALKLMFTTNGQQKEGIQDAKRLGKKTLQIANREAKKEDDNWQLQQLAYLNGKTDFNQYLD